MIFKNLSLLNSMSQRNQKTMMMVMMIMKKIHLDMDNMQRATSARQPS
jgi:hypothetical protein